MQLRHGWAQLLLVVVLILASWPLMAEEAAELDQAEPAEAAEAAEAASNEVEALEFEDLVEAAGRLMQRGQARQAWALLAPREGEFAGDIEYDYLLGIAALDTGRPAPASLAFERILVQRPNHAGARMGLARAWFGLGDYERARAEFETLRDMDPPQRARVAIARYLDIIDDRTLPPVRTRLTGNMAVGGGYDSNVNRATDRETVAIPALGGFELSLSEDSQETSDNYGHLAGGVLLEHALSESVAIFGGVDGSGRAHFDERQYDTLRGDLRAGIRLRTDRHYYTLGLSGGQLWVDGSRNRTATGLNAQWRWLATRNDQLALFTRANRFRHPDTLDVQDADQVLLGASWLRNLGAGGRTRMSLTLLGGTETARGGRSDGDMTLVGARAGLQHLLRQDLLIVGSGGIRQDSYDQQNAIFQREREDTPVDLSLHLDWRLDGEWTVRPALSYLDHDSNIPVNEFDRVDLSLTLRRDFR